MNILYVMRFWPVYGGGETVTVTLSNELVRRGHSVFVVTTKDRFVSPMPYEVDERIKSEKMHTIENYTQDDVENLRNYINKNDIDVMINQWGDSTLCNEARKGTKCKFVTCCHVAAFHPMELPQNRCLRQIYRFLGNKLKNKLDVLRQLKNHNKIHDCSDRYIFLSKSNADAFSNQAHLRDSSKVGYISNPLTYDYFYDMKCYGEKKKEVIFVGRIEEFPKRVSYVLKIWSLVEQQYDAAEWSLKVVGDGSDLPKIKEMASELGLKRVSFEGFTNPRPYYERASIFMMTSSFEGFGMTIVEAMQYACVPMVMDSFLTLRDIITDSENGLIIPNDAIELFVKKMLLLMNDYECRKQMAAKCVENCKKFSLERIVDQWEKEFNQLIRL